MVSLLFDIQYDRTQVTGVSNPVLAFLMGTFTALSSIYGYDTCLYMVEETDKPVRCGCGRLYACFKKRLFQVQSGTVVRFYVCLSSYNYTTVLVEGRLRNDVPAAQSNICTS